MSFTACEEDGVMLDGLRKVALDAGWKRVSMSDAERAHYSPPAEGAFVGEHTGFVVVPHNTVLALLDVAEAAADIASDDYLEQPGPYATGITCEEAVALTEAVRRLREATS